MSTSGLITSRSNPVIKSARMLREGKERKRTGKFLVEGILHVGEASAVGWQIDSILFAPELLESEFARNLISSQSVKGVRCFPVSADVLESLAEKENPQGIVAIVNQNTTSLEMLSPGTIKIAVALIAPQDPGNVGTILRTLDAFGGDALFLLDGGVELFHPSVVRASMGAIFWKPVVKANFVDFITWARQLHYQLIGTSAHAELDYRKAKLDDGKLILVLGNEQKGLSKEQLAACDVVVKIPMRGKASSLNLAVAASVLLYGLEDQPQSKN
jgi:TrmH family RNA methyltransferase